MLSKLELFYFWISLELVGVDDGDAQSDRK